MLSFSLSLVLTPDIARAASDKQLLAAASREQSALIDTLEKLVAIESGSGNIAGLSKIANMLANRLQVLGFKTERRKSPADVGADTVIGTIAGNGSAKIMLMAHMDTVYEAGILQTQPYKIDGNKLYGPGIADAKGGIAVILHALQILFDSDWKDFSTLTVLFNPDEETGSAGSGQIIADIAGQSDVVLSFEPTGIKDVGEWLLLGTASYASVRLEIKGQSSHAGSAPEKGRNAVIELAHQLLQTKDAARAIPGAQLNWTNIVADQAFNQIPDLAIAIGDARITVPGAEKQLQEALQSIVESNKLVGGTQAKVTIEILRPGYRANPAGYAVAQLAQDIQKELNRRPFWIVPMARGATDAGYAALSGNAAVVESLGLSGHGYHAQDEYIEIDSIVPRLYLITRLLTELGKN
ncbi:glutamate carboxypeptidase [Gammaproteobacteria bacterium]|nr:glutamate carboxypeptidase [Gammaproteobacteria bacterium]